MEKMSDNICSPVVARAPWIVDGRTHPVKLLAAAISGSCTSPTQPVPGPIGYQKNTNANTKNILDTNRDVLGASVSARKPIPFEVQIPILLK